MNCIEFHLAKHDIIVGETSEAIGLRTQRDKRRAGALMAKTNGLFGASAGEFTRHVTGHGLTSRLRCHNQF